MTVLRQCLNEPKSHYRPCAMETRRAHCSLRVVGLCHMRLRPSHHSMSNPCLHACLPRLRRLRVAIVAQANSQATPAADGSSTCLRRALVRVPEARVQELVVQFRHLRRQRLVSQARCGLEVVSVALLFRRDAGHGRQLSR